MAPSPATQSRSALKAVVCLIVLVVIVFAVFVARAPRSVPSRTVVSLQFVGYTNRAGGGKFALFRMTNDGPWRVRYGLAAAQVKQGTVWPALPSPLFPAFTNAGVLPSHTAATLEFPASSKSPWRVPFIYSKDVKQFELVVGDFLQLLGVENKNRISYVLYSDEITD